MSSSPSVEIGLSENKQVFDCQRHSLPKPPRYRDRLVADPRLKVYFATISERRRLRSRFLCPSHQQMHVEPHCFVVPDHLTVLGYLSCAVLTLPGELDI